MKYKNITEEQEATLRVQMLDAAKGEMMEEMGALMVQLAIDQVLRLIDAADDAEAAIRQFREEGYGR